MIIAVDGPSGAGKSTVCREVAKRLKWRLLDTGAIYRCVALRAMEAGVDGDPARCAELARALDIRFVSSDAGQRVFLGDRDVTAAIRTFETTQCVNRISPMGEVRAELLGIQRKLGKEGDCIVEGRDIGSVVFPEADLKIYYTASAEARARRRLREFESKGEKFTFDEVVKQIRQRDNTEFHRANSPLIQCNDALVCDTSALNFEQSCAAMIKLIRARQADLEK